MQAQHAWGAQQIQEMLVDLKGFYLKLGQILASKADMLPAVYREALEVLLDDMPQQSQRHIATTIRRELGAEADQVCV